MLSGTEFSNALQSVLGAFIEKPKRITVTPLQSDGTCTIYVPIDAWKSGLTYDTIYGALNSVTQKAQANYGLAYFSFGYGADCIILSDLSKVTLLPDSSVDLRKTLLAMQAVGEVTSNGQAPSLPLSAIRYSVKSDKPIGLAEVINGNAVLKL